MHLQNICILVWVLSEVTIFYWVKHSSREPLSYAIHRWHLDPRILSPLLNLITFLPVFGISSWLQRSPGLQELHLYHNRYTIVSGGAAGHKYVLNAYTDPVLLQILSPHSALSRV